MPVSEQFAEAISRLGPFEPSPILAVALSGGADSMALVLLADAWARAQGGRVIALTVDHALREESHAEARQVAAWMQARGIEHHVLVPLHTPAGNNLMQAARTWRYHALSEFCRANDLLHCLVAQHEDDQLETALLQESRGVTEDGGAGMSAIRLYRGVRFLRPLLATPKADLLAFLRIAQVPWVEDPTNQQIEFKRTQMRIALQSMERAPLQEKLVQKAMARLAREAELARVALDVVRIHPCGFATLERQRWLALPDDIRTQLLADLITTIGGHIHRPRQHETTWLDQALRAADDGKQTLGHCLVEWQADRAVIAREPARVAGPETLRGRGMLLWDQRFRVHYDLTTPLTLGALGNRGRKLLGIGLPHATPALWHLDDLYFVPHIGWTAGKPLTAAQFTLGFAPAKPLAARSFWWFTAAS